VQTHIKNEDNTLEKRVETRKGAGSLGKSRRQEKRGKTDSGPVWCEEEHILTAWDGGTEGWEEVGGH